MFRPNPPPGHNPKPRLLVVVEGINDIQFLRRISRILHADQSMLPDLTELEHAGDLLFIPFGGGDLKLWADRLAPFGKPELHIYDRETPAEAKTRQRIQRWVNGRPHCRAFVTGKRSLENYLHPTSIRAACGLELTFDDQDSVPRRVARALHARNHEVPWDVLPFRLRKRRCDRAKRWLNTRAVEQMTVPLLAEQDPAGDVISWMQAVGELSGSSLLPTPFPGTQV